MLRLYRYTGYQSASKSSINCVLLCTRSFTDRRRLTFMTLSRQSRDYLVVQISDLHTRVTTMCRALPLDLASDLLPSLALRLGTVCHLSWEPVGSTFRRRLKAELFSRAYGVSLDT